MRQTRKPRARSCSRPSSVILSGPHGGIQTQLILMSFTSPPVGPVVRAALTGGPDGGLVNDIKINWVWIPPWGPDKITEDGRDQLRALGFTV